MAWTIYCHVHTETGRRYVGLTSRTWQRRWAQHLSQSKKLASQKTGWSHFANAIRKYGRDAFFHEVLEMCDTLEAANESEQKWISHFGTRDLERGFNITPGGAHTPHSADNAYRSSPEYLEAQRKAAEERWKDPEYRARTLEATQEALALPEVRRKLSEAVSDLWKNPNYREKQHASLKESAARPEVRQKLRENWDDPSFRERCSVGPLAHIAEQSRKTHCLRGHEYTPENTVLSQDGHRECKACNYARKKAAKTSCPKGHPYDEGNVLLSSSGRRMCAVCLAESKVIKPCSKCGGPKDMRIGTRWRCRPCTNGRIAAWGRASRASCARTDP
jgi:GIY-YIG catalytic domain